MHIILLFMDGNKVQLLFCCASTLSVTATLNPSFKIPPLNDKGTSPWECYINHVPAAAEITSNPRAAAVCLIDEAALSLLQPCPRQHEVHFFCSSP